MVKKQQNLVPPKKKAALKKAVETGETGKAFRQREPKAEPTSPNGVKSNTEKVSRDPNNSLDVGIQVENIEMVQEALDTGADVDRKDEVRRITPLMFATIKGNLDIVELLLERGADVMIEDDDGRLAIDLAYEHGEVEIIRRLDKEKIEERRARFNRLGMERRKS